jgi:tetratricopeptide (TPR) repeat protein
MNKERAPNKHCLTLAIACLVPTLSGCISAPATQEAMKVSPLFQVSHADTSAAGLYQLGRYYQAQNRLAQAEDAYRKALATKVDFVDAHSALGTLYAGQGKYDEAIREFSAVLQTAPQIAQLYNNLGYTYYLQGNYQAAVDALQRATALEPGNPRPFNNLGAAYEKLGRKNEAKIAYARAEDLQPGSNQHPAGATRPQVKDGPVSGAGSGTDRIAAAPVQDFVGPPSPESFPGVAPAPVGPITPIIPTYRLEVVNGNGTPWLARRFREALVSAGTPTPRLANLKPYREKQTVIEYRPGYREAALQVRSRFARPIPVSEQAQARGSDVRVILGHDVTSTAALLRQTLARAEN